LGRAAGAAGWDFGRTQSIGEKYYSTNSAKEEGRGLNT